MANSLICFIKQPCLYVSFYPMLIACLQSEIKYQRKLAAICLKSQISNSLPFACNGCLFLWGAYFCMAAYKHNVVVIIKMGACIQGVLILCGCLLSGFYSTCLVATLYVNMLTWLYVTYYTCLACTRCWMLLGNQIFELE